MRHEDEASAPPFPRPFVYPDGASPLYPFVKRAVLGLDEGKNASESDYVCVITVVPNNSLHRAARVAIQESPRVGGHEKAADWV